MTHELQPIMTPDCLERTDAEDSGFWDRKFQKKAIKAIMIALIGYAEPKRSDWLSADDETIIKL